MSTLRPKRLRWRGTLGPGLAPLGLIALGLMLLAWIPRFAVAHPMGNFSISHYSGIRVEAGFIELRYLLDMAEIPTFQEMQETGIVPEPSNPRVISDLARHAEAFKGALKLTLNGRPLVLETVSEDVIFPAGAGGLPTMKMGFLYRAALPEGACLASACTLYYHDGNFPDRAGWKEIVGAPAPGLTLLSSTAAATSRSQELANYPTDLINSPPQDLSARLTFALPAESLSSAGASSPTAHRGGAAGAPNGRPVTRLGTETSEAARSVLPAGKASRLGPGAKSSFRSSAQPTSAPITVSHPAPLGLAAPVLALEANKQKTPRNRFTELITSNQAGLWFLLSAALIAAVLGGLHALEPGHGKTIVAAYLVGSQGTGAHALLLGLIVTATHTAGVYALGLITLYASRYIVPDHLYPWLGVLSGLTIAALGAYMLYRRRAGHHHGHDHHHHHGPEHGAGHVHDHGHEHLHSHGLAHTHSHEHAGLKPAAGSAQAFSYRQLVALGITGGIVPCPAALVVLLSAVALHRVAFGLYLIVAFSVGLAAVLISIGLLTVYARRLLRRVPADGPVINRWLPMASAAVITCLGVAITVQGFVAMGVIRIRL